MPKGILEKCSKEIATEIPKRITETITKKNFQKKYINFKNNSQTHCRSFIRKNAEEFLKGCRQSLSCIILLHLPACTTNLKIPKKDQRKC